MLRFIVVPVIMLISQASTYQTQYHFANRVSAASPAQIKFAIENKYDQTGPGAKEPETAFHTFKYLDDALVAYLDDPDTKLPPHEKARALQRLYKQQNFKHSMDEHVKPINMYTGMAQKTVPLVLKRYNKLFYDPKKVFLPVVDLRGLNANDAGAVKTISSVDPYKWQKEQAPKRIPLTVNVYNKEEGDYRPSPEYFFSFDNNQAPNGQKQPPNGYYTYMDKNGRKRTVLYHSDDRPGFRSTLKQIFTQ